MKLNSVTLLLIFSQFLHCVSMRSSSDETNFVVLISANSEWGPVRETISQEQIKRSPFGEWFTVDIDLKDKKERVIIFHGGWGKVAAAASTQYIIDRWSPQLLINFGTCGGIEGRIHRGEKLLIERTIIYDIVEQMGDSEEAIQAYTTDLDLSWLEEPLPLTVRRSAIVSADRDLVSGELNDLVQKYDAIAGDWESGAIAWVANRNKTNCMILRTVSDLVNIESGEVYGNLKLFQERTAEIMRELMDSLPDWIKKFQMK